MKLRAIVLALVPASAVALGAAAQDAGGIRLTFGLSERVQATRNLALDPVSQGTTLRSDTGLNVRLVSETRDETFALSSNASLRWLNQPNADSEIEVGDPNIAASYNRRGPGSSFRLSGQARSDDIAFQRPLSDFINEDGELELPTDLDELEGTGTRLRYSASTALRWGQDGPLGFGISAGGSVTDYRDAAPTLYDSRNAFVALQVMMEPVPGRTIDTTLRYAYFDNDNSATDAQETLSLSTRIGFDLQTGRVFSNFGVTHVDEGTRLTAGLGYQRDLPDETGSFGFNLNATRTTQDTLALTGSLNLNREMPIGRINAQVRRSVSENDNNQERVLTGAALGFSRALSPRTNVNLGLDYTRSTPVSSDNSITNATLRAGLGYQLTPDWSLNAGYSRRYRKDDAAGTGWRDSDTVYFGISRQFGTRF